MSAEGTPKYGWRCTFGGRRLPRCQAEATLVVQAEYGKHRPRCAAHVDGRRVLTPEEANVYWERRATMGRPKVRTVGP